MAFFRRRRVPWCGHPNLNPHRRGVFRRRRVPWCGHPNLNPDFISLSVLKWESPFLPQRTINTIHRAPESRSTMTEPNGTDTQGHLDPEIQTILARVLHGLQPTNCPDLVTRGQNWDVTRCEVQEFSRVYTTHAFRSARVPFSRLRWDLYRLWRHAQCL